MCFLFQQPQPEVIKGVLETLNLCQLHNYDDISGECYAWFVKYYGKIFTDRQFATYVIALFKKSKTQLTLKQFCKI